MTVRVLLLSFAVCAACATSSRTTPARTAPSTPLTPVASTAFQTPTANGDGLGQFPQLAIATVRSHARGVRRDSHADPDSPNGRYLPRGRSCDPQPMHSTAVH